MTINPFDQFIIQRIAADRHPVDAGRSVTRSPRWVFLTLGRRFLNNKHDIIDDRIDVVSRGLMGLTVACARCHDHKFDPIPQKDYYPLRRLLRRRNRWRNRCSGRWSNRPPTRNS